MPWTKRNSKFCRVVISISHSNLLSGQAFSLAVVQAAEQQPNEQILLLVLAMMGQGGDLTN